MKNKTDDDAYYALFRSYYQLAAANAEITRLREGGCAKGQATTQWCGAMQELVGRLTTLAEEWRTTETSSMRVNEMLLAHADALTEAIAAHSGEGE